VTVRFRAEQQLVSLSAIVFLPPRFSEQLGSACEIYPLRFFVSAMNKIDYLKDRARELKREAAEASDLKLRLAKIEASRAFERLAALAIERRRSKASSLPPADRPN